MSYQRERDAFFIQVGPTLGLATTTKLLTYARTLNRLAVAQCNGDWPADNGKREVMTCPLCDSFWVPSQIKGGKLARAAWDTTTRIRSVSHDLRACPDCRTEAKIKLLLEGSPYKAITHGDPRGYVLCLYALDAIVSKIENGTTRGIGVPA